MTTPIIYWSQSENTLRICIHVEDPFKPPIVSFDEKYLKIVPEAFQVENDNQFLKKLEFYDQVVPNGSYFRIGVNEIIYEILKHQSRYWPNLLKSNQNYFFIKKDEALNETPKMYEKEARDEFNQTNQLNLQNSFRVVRSNKNFGRRKKQSVTSDEVKKVFLFLYNLFQFVGFIYVLVVLLIRYAKEGLDSTAGSYRTLGFVIKFLYITQIFEVIYSLMKATNAEPRIQTEQLIFYLLLAYTLIELFKYPYCILKLFYVNIHSLTWLRFTINFILYPISFLTEGAIMFKNLPYFEETQKFSLRLPNHFNFSFSLTVFIRCYLLLGLFPFLYLTLARLYFYRLTYSKKPIFTAVNTIF